MLSGISKTLLFLCFAALGQAHIGSPDIYLDSNAGPYRLFVTIRPPQVIPGVAEISVRSATAGIRDMKVVPLPLFGTGAEHPPVGESLQRGSSDAQFFSGSLWLMADGSWQVRVVVEGSQGAGTLSIPVPALARSTRSMQWQLGIVLSLLGVFLVGGLCAIVGAAVREAKIPAGTSISESGRRRGRVATAIAFGVIALALWAGKTWWDSDVQVYRDRIYKPLQMRAELDNANVLRLNLSEPGWMQPEKGAAQFSRVMFVRKMDDLIIDHNHLMHLYAIRQPGLDVLYHLHPEQAEADQFRVTLPAMPAGNYNLYADVVHENGLPETLISTLHLTDGIGNGARPLSGDDAKVETKSVEDARLGDTFTLPDGYRMRWVHDAAPLRARQGIAFHFELTAPDGSKPADMALYMGMLGHAAFVKNDGSVFAHIHPNGSISMAALMLAQGKGGMADMDHSKMGMTQAIPNEVAFPYGLPSTGSYRIFVQMKHGETIETGVFDVTAK